MRTTVDLPPEIHRRARELAAERHQSLSAVVAELTVRGLSEVDGPIVWRTDERTGFPVVDLGRTVTSAEVADAIDE